MKFELDHLVDEYHSLEAQLQEGEIYSDPKLLKETMQKKKALQNSVDLYLTYKQLVQNIAGAKDLLATEKDPEMLELAKMELADTE